MADHEKINMTDGEFLALIKAKKEAEKTAQPEIQNVVQAESEATNGAAVDDPKGDMKNSSVYDPEDDVAHPISKAKKRNDQWDKMFERLCEYRKKHGSCKVPGGWKEDKQLALWVSNQRRSHRKESLSAERVRKLNSIDFIWSFPLIQNNPRAKWIVFFQELQTLKEQNGHLRIPATNTRLTSWAQRQRLKFLAGTLVKERVDLLDRLGFNWAPYYSSRQPDGNVKSIKDQDQGKSDRTPISEGGNGKADSNDEEETQKNSGTHSEGDIDKPDSNEEEETLKKPGAKTDGLTEKEDAANSSSTHEKAETAADLTEQPDRNSKTTTKEQEQGKSSDKGKDWGVMYGRLKTFKRVHGHLDVCSVAGLETRDLVKWLTVQQHALASGELTADKRQLLVFLGVECKGEPRSETTEDSHPGTPVVVETPTAVLGGATATATSVFPPHISLQNTEAQASNKLLLDTMPVMPPSATKNQNGLALAASPSHTFNSASGERAPQWSAMGRVGGGSSNRRGAEAVTPEPSVGTAMPMKFSASRRVSDAAASEPEADQIPPRSSRSSHYTTTLAVPRAQDPTEGATDAHEVLVQNSSGDVIGGPPYVDLDSLTNIVDDLSDLLESSAKAKQTIYRCEVFLKHLIKKAYKGRAGVPVDVEGSDAFSRLFPLVDALVDVLDVSNEDHMHLFFQCEKFLLRQVEKVDQEKEKGGDEPPKKMRKIKVEVE